MRVSSLFSGGEERVRGSIAASVGVKDAAIFASILRHIIAELADLGAEGGVDEPG